MEKIYYVYEHIRLDTQQVFYVGKGKLYRDRSEDGRNRWWEGVAEKHGWTWRRVHERLDNACAFTLEKLLIAKHRSIGSPLVNLTEGGEGAPGVVSAKRKLVHCSNGMQFENAYIAAEWLNLNGFPMARQGHIASVARGERYRAYGYRWSYDCTPYDDGRTFHDAIKASNGRKVFCSNGSAYETCKEASDRTGISQNAITRAARGDHSQAGGFTWWYDGEDEKDISTIRPRIKPVVCNENNEHFDSLISAVVWLKANGKEKAQGRPLADCASGKTKQAYGYTWSYPE